MTIDEAIKQTESVIFLAKASRFPTLKSNSEYWKFVLDCLRAQKEKDNEKPLTLEELDKMDGQPVWITPSGFWALVYAREGQRTILVSNDRDAVYADKEIALVGPVYRHPPTKGPSHE